MGKISHAFADDYSHDSDCKSKVDWGKVGAVALSSVAIGFLAVMLSLFVIWVGTKMFHTPTESELKWKSQQYRAETDRRENFAKHCRDIGKWPEYNPSWSCEK